MKTLLSAARVVIITAPLTLAGCASFLADNDKFACGGMPQGVKCLNTKSIYNATNYKDYVTNEDVLRYGGELPEGVTEEDLREDDEPKRRRFGKEADEARTITEVHNIPHSVRSAAPMPEKNIPIRTPAKIIRIWIAPWEDDEGYLNMSGYTYTELEPRRWLVGEPYLKSDRTTVKMISLDRSPQAGTRPNARQPEAPPQETRRPTSYQRK
jgi:conjugal transfer pilus assembly protein TraV